jgi:hypothetical protein
MKPKNGYSKPLFSGTTFQLQSVDEVQMVFGKTGEKFKSLPTYNGGIWGSLEFSWDSKVSSTMPWAKGLSFQSQSPGSLEV